MTPYARTVLTGLLLFIFLLAFVFAVLASAELAMLVPQGGGRCELKFPKWLGCAIANHENLAGGLIGAAGTLFAGWIAWTAIQMQVAADERRAQADREEVESVLKSDVDNFAEALGAVWEVLEGYEVSDGPETNRQKIESIAYGIEIVSKKSWLSTSRRMVEVLGWDRRRKYEALFDSLGSLGAFKDADSINVDEVLSRVAEVAIDFQLVDSDTQVYFEGRFQRAGKAWSVGQTVSFMAGLETNNR